jgi:hypothetical protein
MIAIFWIGRKPRCELTHDGRPLIERRGDLLPKVSEDKVVALPSR